MMRGLLRHGLIWTLAVALIVAGLPLAHARDCDAAQLKSQHTASDPHAHHKMHMGIADDAVMDQAPLSQRHDCPPATPCKCLNCSSLCAAFVAPMPQAMALQRRSAAIVYVIGETSRNEATVFIDPGIPIAL